MKCKKWLGRIVLMVAFVDACFEPSLWAQEKLVSVNVSIGSLVVGLAPYVIAKQNGYFSPNLGTYRAMIHDRNSMGLFTSSVTKHARVHMEKYFHQGKPCPVALCVGQDPLLLLGWKSS
jgi:3-octaprenyl-4-hydroxybenzoate carboxy-lyase